MENEIIEIIRESKKAATVTLVPRADVNDISLVPELLSNVDTLLRQKALFFVLDLEHLGELPPSLVVALFEITARVRRKGGNMTIINLQPLAWKDIEHFKPFSYLSEATPATVRMNKIPAMGVSDIKEPVKPAQESPLISALHQNLPGNDDTHFIEIPGNVNSLYKACDFVVNLSREAGFSDTDINKIKICVYEACINVIEHAYHSDPGKTVRVGVETLPEKMVITVYDRGDGFRVEDLQIFDARNAVNNRMRGGMGIPIIKRSMDEVNYYMDRVNSNRLVMVKYIKSK
ncbi:MAG TPA: ATP-binding protein [bacterium]|nr:ATP-binding protein [bacterium]HPN44535.1 ATP-binding protein [bacterium]